MAYDRSTFILPSDSFVYTPVKNVYFTSYLFGFYLFWPMTLPHPLVLHPSPTPDSVCPTSSVWKNWYRKTSLDSDVGYHCYVRGVTSCVGGFIGDTIGQEVYFKGNRKMFDTKSFYRIETWKFVFVYKNLTDNWL